MTPADPRVPELSVVAPLHDEGRGVADFVRAVFTELEATAESFELILVDDGSDDDTWDQIRAEAAQRPQLIGLRLSRNFGKEAALCAGIERAAGRAVITLDGDLQHPPELIGEMVARWRSGEARIVEAVKADRGAEPLTHRINSRAFYQLFRSLTGVDLRGASDYKLLDRSAVDEWLRLPERALFYRGTVWWIGFSRTQVEFSVPERATGRSSWSLLRLVRLALVAVTSFSSAPLQLATFVGLSFFLLAVGLGLHTLYMKLSGAALSGFTTVILLQLIIGSLVLLCVGVVGQYVARIYDEVKGRPRYVLSESVGSDTRERDAK